jgi:hypothetical protein
MVFGCLASVLLSRIVLDDPHTTIRGQHFQPVNLATIPLHRFGPQHLASGLSFHPANRVGQGAAISLGLGLGGGSRRIGVGRRSALGLLLGLGLLLVLLLGLLLGLLLVWGLWLRPNAARTAQKHGEQQRSKLVLEPEHVPGWYLQDLMGANAHGPQSGGWAVNPV